MKHLINWVEIPATNLDRAIAFYSRVLGIEFYPMALGDIEYALFPSEDQFNTGALARGPFYEPSASGPVIYLDGGEDLQEKLDRVEKNGGQVIMTKTYISKEAGFVGMFLDTEGNKIGLQHM
jgi:predicted enzyme related to lactoylglutathione lyase